MPVGLSNGNELGMQPCPGSPGAAAMGGLNHRLSQVWVREPADVGTLADQAVHPRHVSQEAGILLLLLLRHTGLPSLRCGAGGRSLFTMCFAMVGRLSEGVAWGMGGLPGSAVIAVGRPALLLGDVQQRWVGPAVLC